VDSAVRWASLLLGIPALLLPVWPATSVEGAAVMQRQACFECHPSPGVRSNPVDKVLRARYTPTSLTAAIWSHGPKLFSRGDPAAFTEGDALRLLAWFALAGAFDAAGDPKQGAKTFRLQSCRLCHQEKDRAAAPPVSQWPSVHSPAALFLAMWRHAPLMRAALDENRMMWPSLSSKEIRNILAYARQSNRAPSADPPELRLGDPETGRAILGTRPCVTCHSAVQTTAARPAAQTFAALAGILWNHAPMMSNLPPSLNAGEIENLLAYLWQSRYFDEPGEVGQGRTVFESRRCAACHDTLPAVRPYDSSAMLAAFWKHQGPVLEKARELGIVWPKLSGKDMAHLIAYANSVRRPPLVK